MNIWLYICIWIRYIQSSSCWRSLSSECPRPFSPVWRGLARPPCFMILSFFFPFYCNCSLTSGHCPFCFFLVFVCNNFILSMVFYIRFFCCRMFIFLFLWPRLHVKWIHPLYRLNNKPIHFLDSFVFFFFFFGLIHFFGSSTLWTRPLYRLDNTFVHFVDLAVNSSTLWT